MHNRRHILVAVLFTSWAEEGWVITGFDPPYI